MVKFGEFLPLIVTLVVSLARKALEQDTPVFTQAVGLNNLILNLCGSG